MNIKLIIASRLSYYFCGSISLSILNTIDNPVTVALDSLTKQEVIGLSKAIKTGVIKAIEGEEELCTKAATLSNKKKEVTTISEIKEKIENVIEEIKQPVVEITPEPEVQEVTEVKEVTTKPTPRRRTPVKK